MKLFKICTCCKAPWFSRDEFLEDGNVTLVGYQVNFVNLELGFFLFNHLTCQSTISIPAGLFRDLYNGPVFSECLTGSDQCPGYCRHKDMLGSCRAKCECAYVRKIMQMVRDWPKEIPFPDKIAVGQY